MSYDFERKERELEFQGRWVKTGIVIQGIVTAAGWLFIAWREGWL